MRIPTEHVQRENKADGKAFLDAYISYSLVYRYFRIVKKECGEINISEYLTGIPTNYTYKILFASAQVAHVQGHVSHIRFAYYTVEVHAIQFRL